MAETPKNVHGFNCHYIGDRYAQALMINSTLPVDQFSYLSSDEDFAKLSKLGRQDVSLAVLARARTVLKDSGLPPDVVDSVIAKLRPSF